MFIGFAQTRLFQLADDRANGYYIICDHQPMWLSTWVYFFGEHIMVMCLLSAAYFVVDNDQIAVFLCQLFELAFFDALAYAVFYNNPWWAGVHVEYNDLKLLVIFTLIAYNIWILRPSSH